MKTTENYGLKKPEASDFYNVDDFNDNMDAVDKKLKELEDGSASGGVFEENISVPDKLEFGDKGTVGNYGNETVLVAKDSEDPTNQRYLSISGASKQSDLEKAIAFVMVVDGVYTVYEIYGEHNKPTPEEIGAVSLVDASSSDYDMDSIIATEHSLTVYKTNANTLGTPYAKGVTDQAIATIFSESSETYGYQIAFMYGGRVPLMRMNSNGTISDWVKLLSAGQIADNLTTTEEGFALDARQGKKLKELMGDQVTYTLDGTTLTITSK